MSASASNTENAGCDDGPLLDELLPWSVPGLRLGRAWVTAPDPGTLRARWAALTGAEGAERERLFRPTRARTPDAGAAALPGQRTATGRFSAAPGPCPEPVRVLHEPFDEQWLLPDQRLIDAARPELWRVLDEQQLFLLEAGPGVVATALLPAGRTGRVRPLHRRPGGAEPNLAPGLLDLLGARYGTWVAPEEVLCWVLAAARPGPGGLRVPLPADAERWRAGVELGHRLLRIQLRGARGGEPPRLPGGRRPYVRQAVPARPTALSYDAGTETLSLDAGAVSPVPAAAWEYEVAGVRVLERWFAARTAHRELDGLEGLGPDEWPQSWTSELLALVTTLALLAELEPARAGLTVGPPLTAAELRAAGVLPAPRWARRPASVLDHHEEGPGGQFALI
ncbi:type ISP restriction/modification enzyme [Streptomyces antimicrobicus]|uniref:DNA methyltransferase n=1 Tax=Streptomyces antimicrobicus TaxID=2883108 RepID=A0ABS8B5V3_9ACTN|nr:type ISP restriction/modification enzyme [Streptomyces antimicrobicus]MCB5179990.1 DNA methyltransferase [Streptomyces antimicrobicus]